VANVFFVPNAQLRPIVEGTVFFVPARSTEFLFSYSEFSVQCSEFRVQCSEFSVQCSVFSVQSSVFRVILYGFSALGQLSDN
jgi:hypothetical protein